MKKAAYLLTFCILLIQTRAIKAQTLFEILSDTIDIVVAADGSGDYTTIMGAIQASSGNQVIFIKKGVYTEKVEILSGKDKLTLIGEDVDSTIIQWDDYSGSGEIYSGIRSGEQGNEISTFNSHSLFIESNDFTIINLTIKNTAGTVGQAVALQLNGDRTTIIHCRILGNQDTFATRSSARHLVKDTYIEGNVDFIFAESATVFDSCVINSNRSSSHITAPSTKENWKFGYVFQNCLITANHGVSNVYFARPWWNAPKAVWMNCYLGEHIAPKGWENPWQNVPNENCTFAEYKNYGPGSDTSLRVDWSFQMTDAEAALYTQENILSKNTSDAISADWNPDIYNNYFYKVVRSNTDLLYDEQYNNAYLSSLKYNQETLIGFDPTITSYSVELPAEIQDIPEIYATTQSAKAEIDTIIYPESLPGTVTIKVTASNGFTLTYRIIFSIAATAIMDTKSEEKISLYFNQENDFLQIKGSEVDGELHFVLFSLTGVKLLDKKLFSQGHFLDEQIDVSHLENGIYVYLIQAGNQRISGKVIKS